MLLYSGDAYRLLFWIYVFYDLWFSECVSYAGICGSKIRSPGINWKYYVGAWKIISAHLPCGVYAFEEGCTTCSAMWNLFYSRGISCGMYAEYGTSRHYIFCDVTFPALSVLFDSVAPDFWSGYTQFLQSEESGSKESDILWSGWNCIFARMYFRSDNFCATVAECDPAHMHLKKWKTLCSGVGLRLFWVCAPWARSNGCKSRTCPRSGKCIAEQQGCPSWGGIWRKL